MVIRTVLVSGLVMAAGAMAQPPDSPHGRGPGPRVVGAMAGMPGRAVKNAPFSADIVTESTQTLADGSHIKRTNTVKVYRDSEGRTRREQSLGNLSGLTAGSNGQSQVAFISDPVAGASYALDLTNRTATKSTMHQGGRGPGGPGQRGPGGPPNGAAPRGRPAPPADGQAGQGPQMGRFGGQGGPGVPGGRGRNRQNVRTESLGKQNIEGVLAEGTRTTMTIPAGEIGNEQPLAVVDETWYSSELQAVVLRKHSDPRQGETTTRYMNVSRSEPARIMFEPPADFKLSEPGRGRAAKQ
jgi:hypothetical protein